MKSLTKLIIMAFISALLALTSTAHCANDIYSVDEFLEKGDETMVGVSVQGVVGRAFSRSKRFTLIDLAEYEECGVVTCAQGALHVLWAGEMPESEEKVTVHGNVTKKSGRLMFEADKIGPLE